MATKKKKTKMTAKAAAKRLREYAMTFPGAHEDFPWGERVVKVKKKVFVFLGRDFGDLGMSVKLPKSKATARARTSRPATSSARSDASIFFTSLRSLLPTNASSFFASPRNALIHCSLTGSRRAFSRPS